MPDIIQEEDFHFNINDFLGGVNSYIPPNKGGNNFLTKCQNAVVLDNGTITRRPAITRVGTIDTSLDGGASPFGDGITAVANHATDIAVLGEGESRNIFVVFTALHTVEEDGPDFTAKYAICVTNYNDPTSGSDWNYSEVSSADPATLDFPVSGLSDTNLGDNIETMSSSAYVRESTGTEYLYIVAAFTGLSAGGYGVDGKSWSKWSIPESGDATEWSTIPDSDNTPPAGARYVLNHGDRIWAAGLVGDNRELLYHSNVVALTGNGNEYWDRETDWNPFGTSSGEAIRGIGGYKENMIFVGLEGTIALLAVGTSADKLDWRVIYVSKDIGVGAHRTIVNVSEDLFFMDQAGQVRALTTQLAERGSAVRSGSISLPIKDRTDQAYDIFRSNAAFFDGSYWLSFPVDGGWELYSYSIELSIWSGPHVIKNSSGAELNVISMVVNSGGEPGSVAVNQRSRALYFLTDDGVEDSGTRYQVYKIDSSSVKDDASTAIDVEVITRAHDFDFPHIDKWLKWVEISYYRVDGATGSFDFWCRTDFGDWVLIADAVNYTEGTAEIQWKKFPIGELVGRGRVFQFKITSSDTTTNFQIERIIASGSAFEVEDENVTSFGNL